MVRAVLLVTQLDAAQLALPLTVVFLTEIIKSVTVINNATYMETVVLMLIDIIPVAQLVS